MLLFDAGLTVRAANPAFLRTFRLAAEDVAGRFVADLDGGRWDVPALRALLQEALRGDAEPDDRPFAYDLRHGGSRSLLLGARRVAGPKGRPEAIVVTVEDVTDRLPAGCGRPGPRDHARPSETARVEESGGVPDAADVPAQVDTARRRMEEVQRESEALKTAILQTALDCIITIDHEGRVVEFNPAAERTFGYARGEAIGRPIVDLIIPPSQREAHTRGFARYLATGEGPMLGQRVETMAMRADGTLLPVELAITATFTQGSRSFTAYLRDLSERRCAERENKRLANHMRLLLETTAEGIYGIDLQGRCTFINRAAARMIGYEPADVIGRNMHDLIHHSRADGTHCPSEECAIFRSFRVGRGVRVDNEVFWRRDGTPFPVEYSSSPMIEGGVIMGAVVAFSDITARKRGEEQILTLNRTLQQRLRRTKALRRIDAAVTTRRELGQTLGLIVEEAIEQLGLDAAEILLYDEATGMLEPAAGRGVPAEGPGRPGPASRGLARRVAEEGCRLHIPDLVHAPQADGRIRRLVEAGFVAYHAIPLTAETRVKGVLECFRRAPVTPDAEWLGFARILAGQAAIAIDNATLIEDLRQSNDGLRAAYDATIEGWSRALDLRDKETEGHSQRVTEMALKLARAMGMAEDELVHIRRGALLHDIGKLGVPDAILLKPGPLTPDEREVMRRHPECAREWLSPIAFLQPALEIPQFHHERWDGAGYPSGLAGEEIPLAARVFAVVDIWDALTHDRPYRRAWSEERVREHLRTLAGNHLDPRVVDVFLGFLGGD